MRVSKYRPKVTVAFSAVVLFLAVGTSSAAKLPAVTDINSLAEKAKSTAETFTQDSFNLRMQYEYSGDFLEPKDKDRLYVLAQTAINQLFEVTEKQRKFKQQIEDYQGDDWDIRYGVTGLWRKLSANLYATVLSRCKIHFYIAQATEQDKKKNLRNILNELDTLGRSSQTADSQLLKAKAFGLLAQKDPNYISLAKKEFTMLAERSDMRQVTAFWGAIERIKLFGPASYDELGRLTDSIAQSKSKNDFELILTLAFLRRRFDSEALEKTAYIWPQTEGFLGEVVLSDLSQRLDKGELAKPFLQQISLSEVELAAMSAWKGKARDYKELLENLAGEERFQTPLIMYVAAAASAESDPAKTVSFLISSAKLQKAQKSDSLKIDAEYIADQAAKLAYSYFTRDKINCESALEAFENYIAIADDKTDQELEYFYSKVLGDCGLSDKSKKLLQKIAGGHEGYWRDRAGFDLILHAIQQDQRQSETIEQLSDLLTHSGGQNEKQTKLRCEAITLYCQMLFESQDSLSAQKVLEVISEADTDLDPNLNVFKSKAYRLQGRLDEAARCMLEISDEKHCDRASESMELLSVFIDKIERLQDETENFAELATNFKTIAKFAHSCIKTNQSSLFWAEISVFAAAKNPQQLLAVEQMLDKIEKAGASKDINYLRCRARLLTEKGSFEQAAALWSQICEFHKDRSEVSGRRSSQWWRAKFYELYCGSKQPEKQKILHCIEVLESSFRDIPPLWAGKIGTLKLRCREQTN